MKDHRLMRVLTLFTVVLMLSAAAVINNGKLFGHDFAAHDEAEATSNDTITYAADGSMVVNTTALGKDIMGYGGNTPLEVHISADGHITEIHALPNDETPEFFARAEVLTAQYEGRTVDEALAAKVDGVSGATYSSQAIKGNVEAALSYVQKVAPASSASKPLTAAAIAAIVAALMAAVLPLVLKGRRWHVAQLVVNVAVLGLWSGTFVSYSLLLNIFTNGIAWSNLAAMAAPIIMLVTAFVYPLFGKANYYCANVCPLGSIQELASMLGKKKIRLPRRLAATLDVARNVLWGVLIGLLLTGVCTSWMSYELFTAFLFSSASVWVLVAYIAVLVLSVFVPRPYCRFVCPTGALMRRF